jgi:ABC-2 type transport system ATP-binding protein
MTDHPTAASWPPGDKRAAREPNFVVDVRDLVRRYGRTEAVDRLNLRVSPGRCFGFFGRNGAGKTTTIKCLLNLLRPTSGQATLFGLDAARHEVEIKARLAYVPDAVAFYPWMTVRDVLDYARAFRRHWNTQTERALLSQFRVDPRQKASHLSKGQRTQLALITAVCPEPELLILDEPTSGLDPIVRREFIQTVIGAYQDGDPTRRTVFVSTHLISEFEGLIDEFTIIDRGREVLTLEADAARERYQRIRARFATPPPALDFPAAADIQARGREIELIAQGNVEQLLDQLRAKSPEALTVEALSLEEIFVATLQPRGALA